MKAKHKQPKTYKLPKGKHPKEILKKLKNLKMSERVKFNKICVDYARYLKDSVLSESATTADIRVETAYNYTSLVIFVDLKDFKGLDAVTQVIDRWRSINKLKYTAYNGPIMFHISCNRIYGR